MIEIRFVWLIESDGSRKFLNILCPQIPKFGYPTSEFYVKSYRYIELYQNMHYSVLSHSAVWKSTIKSDHDFRGKINIFSVKSTFLLKKLISRKIFERDRVF